MRVGVVYKFYLSQDIIGKKMLIWYNQEEKVAELHQAHFKLGIVKPPYLTFSTHKLRLSSIQKRNRFASIYKQLMSHGVSLD